MEDLHLLISKLCGVGERENILINETIQRQHDQLFFDKVMVN